ncbi:AMP-binding protein [Sphaerimonospora cavernae]|uniref:AMP-binding protein n=1 Tax=Sphaerimonospora cavernae TaxID=1740611 RepID=A0ABV6U0R8_9ACTN
MDRAEKAAFQHGQVIHEAFVRHAALTPQATALLQGPRRLTYDELDRASTFYANELLLAGIGPGCKLPVVLPRSMELVAVLLAVLKTGAAYAALDPRWPAERIKRIAEALRSSLTVTCVLPLSKTVDIGGVIPDIPCRGTDAATVFFTSGTSGTPRGVVSPHQATTRLFQKGSFADFGSGHTTASAAAISWDAFTLELWGPLVSGGTVALNDADYLLPSTLKSLVGEHGVDTAWLTSSLFNMFVDEDLSCFHGLSQLMIGGERLSPEYVGRFLNAHPEISLINGYGPVESCVFATTHRIRPEDITHSGGIPLGRAVPVTDVYVIHDGRRCAPEEEGEICVGGAGLAHEYLNDAEATAERFVHLNLGGEEVRLYRTGDIGYTNSAGLLHYRGRADRQVKLRGHRIEPHEIERHCAALNGVTHAVVVPVSTDGQNTDRLALFYVAGPGAPVTPSAVRRALSESLPGYLVPEQIDRLDALPITPNGKTDYQHILSLARASRRADDAGDATGAFHEILRIVESGADTVDPDAAFAALGGSSLDALRLCARLQSRFGPHITVSRFMRDPTLRGVLTLIREKPPESALSGIHPSDSSTVPLRGMQAHFSMAYETSPADTSSACRLTWRVIGDLDVVALERALNDVHDRHQALRAAYRLAEGPVADLPSGSRSIRLTVLPQDTQGGDPRTRLSRRLAGPLRIDRGEIWRCVLAELDERVFLLGVVVHHVAFDGWSQSLLVSELSTAYSSRRNGSAPAFDGAAPTMAFLANELSEFSGTPDHARQIEYWTSVLRGIPELEMPRPAEQEKTQRSGRLTFFLEEVVVHELNTMAKRYGSTVFLLLIVGYDMAVREVFGQYDFGIGVPVTGRFTEESLRAITCLTDMVCVRLPRGRAGDSLTHRLEVSREAVRGALAHQGVRFGDVVAALRLPRTGRNPCFQTIFAYQNNEQPDLVLDGCSADLVAHDGSEPLAEVQCEVWPTRGGLLVDFAYRADAVSAEAVRRLAAAYEDVLRRGARP